MALENHSLPPYSPRNVSPDQSRQRDGRHGESLPESGEPPVLASHQFPEIPLPAGLPAEVSEALHLYERAIASSSCGIVISDVSQPDYPVIYCNRAFTAMTGYSEAEVLGQNCRILQGPETEPEDVERLRSAIAAGDDCTVILRNYRRDGTPFWNRLNLSPVRSTSGVLSHYIGIQTDVTAQQEEQENQRRQLQAEQLLRHVTQRIRSSLQLEQVLAITVTEVKAFLQADRILVYQFEADWTGTVVAEAVTPPWTVAIHQSIDDTRFRESQGQLYCDGRIVAIEDIETAGLSDCYRDLWQRFEVRANLVVPILQGDRQWGLLIAHQCEGPRQWSAFETKLMEQVANQLAFAVTQAELYQQAQAEIAQRQQAEQALQQAKDSAERRLEGEQLLRQVTQRIRATLDLDQVLTTTVQEVERLLETNRVVVYRFQPDWNGLVVAEAIRGPWTPSLNQIIEDTCFRENHGKLYRRGRVAAIADVYNAGLSPCYLKLLERFEVRSNLVVPIVYGTGTGGDGDQHINDDGDRLWGLLIAHQCEGPRQWSDFEMNVMGQVADQLALAVIQAELYGTAQAEIRQRQEAEQALQASKAQVERKVDELGQALEQLKWHQTQLLQSEKLSSLGQLVGGIAHEINNPVSFIYGNMPYAREYVTDLLKIVRQAETLTQAQGDGGQLQQAITDLSAAIAGLDLNFIETDIHQVFNSIIAGAERIRDMVLSLRAFSTLDEASFKPTDFRNNLDSILVLLQSRLGGQQGMPVVRIDKHYGEIPLVYCCVSEVNQVFMNILNNALDAIEEQWQLARQQQQSFTPTLQLTVQLCPAGDDDTPQRVAVTLANNGIPLTDEVRSHLFDPFFTTKPVGKGTGLGLSIAYQTIVKRHNGQITCHSQANPQETSFTLEIPVGAVKENARSLISK